jgi:transcriptional regulator with PAS, ATPase and Fis domain
VESELFGYERGAFTGAAARTRGRFEQAHGGTVFLDEIGDMSPFAQAKILRVIEDKRIARLGGGVSIPIDLRLIAATNREPETLMAEGHFRDDLYYRLNVARVHMPSLREHREDIPTLVACGIRRLNRKFDRDLKGLSSKAMEALHRYNWPGNVRELMNLLEAAYINMPTENGGQEVLEAIEAIQITVTSTLSMVLGSLAVRITSQELKRLKAIPGISAIEFDRSAQISDG